MQEIDELNQAIIALEAQRDLLGDRVVDAAQASLREKLASLEQYTPTGRQRRLVTVLFLDLVNSTLLSQGLEPEEVQEVVGNALKRLAGPVEACDGQVIQFMGDGFMAVFGLKVTRENDARQAVRAGLAILAEARACAEELEQRSGLKGFNVRLGFNTGRVVAGRFSQGESPVMGLTVSLAARVEQSAHPGTLFISHFTYQHVRGAFDMQALPPISAKGFSQPVAVYQVLSARPRTFRTFTRGVQGIETRLVGREAELHQLQEAFNHAVRAGQTQLVTILGEAGVGKSRLLYEFDRWVAQFSTPVMAFKARASPQTISVPFSLLREMIGYHLGMLTTDPLEVTRHCLVEGLSAMLEDEAEMKAHFVGALLGFDFSNSPYLQGVEDDPRQLRDRGQYYLSQYLASVAGQSPTVLLLDDIHWADGPSLDFISQWVYQYPQLKLMVVCLGRPAFSQHFPAWAPAETLPGQPLPGYLPLELEPLSRPASQELMAEILGEVEAFPELLSRQILDQADGNPFYIEEFIQALLDAHVIHAGSPAGKWQLDQARLGRLELPGTLVALLEARLDSLTLPQRSLLQQASVIGQVFWSSALQAVRGDKPVSEQELELLTRRGFIYPREPSTFASDEEYHFHHALLRDVAYQALLKPDRKEHHARVAGWLIETIQGSGRVGEFASLVAGHYEQAGENSLAADWYIQAGQRARTQGAPAQARSFFDHALSLFPAEVSPSTPASDLARRWAALFGRDDVLGILGDTEGRMADDVALVSLAQLMKDDNLLAEAYFRQGYYLGVSGHYQQEWQAYNHGLEAARRAENRRCQALILGLKVHCEVHLGDLDSAGQTSAAALKYAEELGDREVLARNLTNVSIYYTETGDMARAVGMLEQQLEINRQISNLEGEVTGLSNLGYAYIMLGNLQAAMTALQQCIQMAAEIGMRSFHAYGCLNLGLAYLRQGDLVQAMQILEQCLPDLRSMNDILDYATGQTYMAMILEQEGRLGEALDRYQQAAGMLREIGALGNLYDAEAGAVRCLLKLEHLDAALERAVPLWEYLQQHAGERMEFPVLAYETCADVFAVLDRAALARRAIGAGYGELLVRAGKISLPEWRRSFLEQVPEHRHISERWKQLVGIS
jgi:class 3 adenylate cyclase/tetratricopeptide (TPR) repeat protein